MKKQKNKFWLFVFSLWPGAGHMYMGLMKMGLSFMSGFMLALIAVSFTGLGLFVVSAVVIYIYSFFHANNIGGMDAAQFAALEDEYLFGIGEWDTSRFRLDKKNRNIAAVVCILIGVSMLWNVGFGMLRDYMGWDNPFIKAVYYTMRDEVPRAAIAIAIIWFGVSLIRGKKMDSVEKDRKVEADSEGKPAALPGEAAQEWNTDGQSADRKSMGEQTPDVENVYGQSDGEKNEQGGV